VKSTLILFTKEPIPGKVKTRLIPALGIQGAYNLYCQLLNLMLDRFANTDYADLIIYSLNSLKNNNSYFINYPEVKEQQGENLGDKMYNALAQELHNLNSSRNKNKSKVILFGADCPFITEQKMWEVIEALEKNDLVFIPALDGGYVLIGATKICSEVFQNISWSTPQVMLQTRKNLDILGYNYQLLEPLRDIDEAEDLDCFINCNLDPTNLFSIN
jgi:uncharacterized protein